MTRAACVRLCVLLLALAWIPGCVKPDLIPRFTPAWEAFDPDEGGWKSTIPALVCSDCQIHNIYSKPVPERNLSAEAAAATAIRPPQLDLFAPDVLAWILKEGSEDAEFILHLGDALNLATTGEFRQFLEIIEGAGKPWFMAPGNHDFYYFGVYAPERPELPEAAAYRSGVPLHKGHFIRLYVAALLRQSEPGCAELARALGIEPGADKDLEEVGARLPASFEWRRSGDTQSLLAGIFWNIDEEVDWRSFILQDIDATGGASDIRKLHVYLLDSCQYDRRPDMTPNAWRSYPVSLNCGLTGEMLPDQLRKIREWLEDKHGSRGTIFMGHHPFESLSPRARTNLGWLWREYECGMMVTAHTHAGYYAHHDLGGERDVIELNIGSTTDWPMEWRTLQAFVNPEQEKIYLRATRRTLVNELQKRGGYFEREWAIPSDARDDYRSYKQGEAASGLLVSYYLGDHFTPYWLPEPRMKPTKAARDTEETVKETLLWTYHRLVTQFPTDADRAPVWPPECSSDRDVLTRIERTAAVRDSLETKVALLVELAAFERSRHTRDRKTGAPTDDIRTRYKISQAAWASRYMSARGRRLRLEDELVNVGWRGSRMEAIADAEE